MATIVLYNPATKVVTQLPTVIATRNVDDPGLAPTAAITVLAASGYITTNETQMIAEVQEATIKYVKGVGWTVVSFVDIPTA